MEPMRRIRIMVVDDHPVVRSGLIKILEKEHDIDIIAEASDGIQAEQLAIELKPDIVLLDVIMPQQGGVETLENIKGKLPETKFLMISMSEDNDDLFAALKAGASGYVLKSEDDKTIINAIRHTVAGESIVSPLLNTKLINELLQSGKKGKFTNIESKILYLLCDGLTNIEIAERLFISESTVRTHINRMIDKLKLRNRSSLIIYAVKNISKLDAEQD